MQKVHETFDQCCIQTNAATQREVARETQREIGGSNIGELTSLVWRMRGLILFTQAIILFGYICALCYGADSALRHLIDSDSGFSKNIIFYEMLKVYYTFFI